MANIPAEVQLAVNILDDKRAEDIVVLNLMEVSDSLDWFVIASGTSTPHLRSLDADVRAKMKEAGYEAVSLEGPSERWVLLDFASVTVHIMSRDAREFYDLEGLWGDAEPVDVQPAETANHVPAEALG